MHRKPETTSENVLSSVKEDVRVKFTDSTNEDGCGGDVQRIPKADVPSKTKGLDQSVDNAAGGRQKAGSTENDDGRLPRATVTNGIPSQPQSQMQPSQPQPPPQPHQPQPQPPTVQTTMNGGPPTTAALSKRAPADRVTVKRSKSNVDGKTLTGRSNNCKAIVEVLDRVDTPQLSATSATVVSGTGGDRNADESAGKPTAFSVLPTGGRDDDRACECPNCRKKPSRTNSSKFLLANCDYNINFFNVSL